MRRILASMMAASLLLSTAVAFIGMGAFAGPSAPAIEADDATWTVMVYLCGDNNLESDGFADMEEMEDVGSKNDVTVIVLMDTIGTVNGTHWYVIGQGEDHVDELTGECSCDCDMFFGEDYACPGELDMGDGATLTYFLVEAVAYAPADNYMLVLWDHGGGWRGVCWDDSTIIDDELGWSSRLTTPETAASIRAAQEQIRKDIDADFKLTMIGYDACLNGMIEVVYENMDIADYMFASINLVPGQGMAYDKILENVTQLPRQSAEDIGIAVVDSYIEYYSELISSGPGLEYFGDVTLSLFQLGQPVDDLVVSVNALSHALVEGNYANDTSFRSAIASADSQTPRIPTYMGEQMPFIDLGLFAEKLAVNIPKLKTLATDVADAVDEVVVYENHKVSPGEAVLRTSGMSIFFTWCNEYLNPAYQFETLQDAEEYGVNTVYWGLAFVVDTWWDEFVFLYSMTYDETLLDYDGLPVE